MEKTYVAHLSGGEYDDFWEQTIVLQTRKSSIDSIMISLIKHLRRKTGDDWLGIKDIDWVLPLEEWVDKYGETV